MKLLIASDIHGSAYWCRALMTQIDAESPDTIVLLGDLLYHGPRNDLPRDYAPKEVLAMLNSLADRVVAVRGNCDSEVDQMVLDFPCMADYAIVMDAAPAGGADGQPASAAAPQPAAQLAAQPAPQSVPKAKPRLLFCTHGHLFGPQNVPPIARGAALLYGHTHVKEIASRDGVLFVNPGSVSLPKDGSNSYAVYENGTFELRELSGE